MNSQEVSYQFGQLGSAHITAAANTVTPPNGMVIVAIQFLEDNKVDVLTPDNKTSVKYGANAPNNKAFVGSPIDNAGATSEANTNGNSIAIDTAVEFPKGVTIYGRWTEFSLATSTDHGVILYFGI